MGAVIYETCVEYFKRRLAEGWKCIGIEGDIASLLSPDGSFHKLDLKNDTATLRPDGAGSSAQGIPIGAPTPWQCVDEVTPDDMTTRVETGLSTAWKSDLHALPDPGLAGTINSVTIYHRSLAYSNAAVYGYAYGRYLTNAVAYNFQRVGAGAWTTLNTGALADNPQSGSPWTWVEIDALQIGCYIAAAYDEKEGWAEALCTWVQVVIDYTPTPPGAPRSHGYIID